MADTRDRTTIHYMIRTQHPHRPDCWLLEFLAPAIAIKLAVTKEEFDKWVRWPPHSSAGSSAPSPGSPTPRARPAASAAPTSSTQRTQSATSASSAAAATPGKRS